MSDPSQSILILGAGVFGLSTSLHLARRGYKDITVLDRQPYDKNHYHPDDGCDGASADINKVFRTTYGDKKEYQYMGLRALPIWREWTDTILNSADGDLPPGLSKDDRLLYESGFMRLAKGAKMSPHHQASLDLIALDGRGEAIFRLNDEGDYARAKAADDAGSGMFWSEKLHRFNALLGGDLNGFLDIDAGFTRADKACVYALHLAKQAGVKFILDTEAGAFESLIIENNLVRGVKTQDGVEHRADKTIVACGGWTPSVVPAVSHLLETTGGSVAYIDLPRDRVDLWDKFGPERFCTWSFQSGDGTGFGGFVCFPRTETGRLKFGYRAVKYTNFETHPVTGERMSIPKTRYSQDPITNLPLASLGHIKEVVRQVFPELQEFGITGTRMCWYTDSIDNDFVADYVPGYGETLFVASGGSGHGFKFLPILGHHFANQLEHVEDEFTHLWKWRAAPPGTKANGLEEGEAGPRVLAKNPLATRDDWKF